MLHKILINKHAFSLPNFVDSWYYLVQIYDMLLKNLVEGHYYCDSNILWYNADYNSLTFTLSVPVERESESVEKATLLAIMQMQLNMSCN